jgi:NAD(P)-dependent dehydrogenase (short-subunit alcohol dehydrogenase family)
MKRTVLVTGCSTGFGRQLSEELARKGDRVYATMRGVKGSNAKVAGELQALAKKEKLDLRVLELDVTSSSSIDAAATKVLAEELAKQLDINVVGVHRVSRAFLPAMRKRGSGLIVNISSIAGRMSLPFFGVYHASKWALEGYSLALRSELASSGVDVVVVEPGPFTTELFPRSPKPADADGRGKSYPAVVHQTFEQMGSAFEQVFKDPAAPTDPKLVVDRMIELIGMKAGTRPFRSVVGLDFGVRDRNAAVEPFDAGVLEAMGMSSFAKLAPKVHV